jgi:hypothetical protein
MRELDRVSRSLQRVRATLSPTPADKARVRARIIAPLPAAADGGGGSGAGALAALDAGALERAVVAPGRLTAGSLTRTPLMRWVALRATGRLGLALGALVLGAGVAIGFWWGSERALRTLERSSIAAPVEAAPPLVGPARPRASARLVSDAAGNAPAPRLEDAVDDKHATPGRSAAMDDQRVAQDRARALTPRATRKPERAPRRARPRSAALASGAGRDHELMLLRRVERAIRSGEPVLALGLLAELDEVFPETTLAEERLAARRLAECRAGRPDASSSARRFLIEHATSVYRQRIELACGLVDHASEGGPMQNAQSADTHLR